MSREIITARDIARIERTARPSFEAAPVEAPGKAVVDASEAMTPVPDDYRSRLVKYIPTEVIAVYLTLAGILATIDDGSPQKVWLFWGVFVILLILTPTYLARVEGVTKRMQLLVSTAAFFVWVFALGGPFEPLGWYDPVYGALALTLVTFAIPLWEPSA